MLVSIIEEGWVGFLDDDDELDEHYHEWLDEEAPGYDMVIFKMKNSPNGAIPQTSLPNQLQYNEVGISFAMPIEIARKFKFRNEIPGEDYDLICRVRDAGYKIKISEHIGYYIHGKDGTN